MQKSFILLAYLKIKNLITFYLLNIIVNLKQRNSYSPKNYHTELNKTSC